MATIEKSTEKRVIASPGRPTLPGKPGAAPEVAEGGKKSKKKKSKKKLLIVIVLVLLLAGGAYYFLVLSKKSGPVVVPAPVPGIVAPVASVSLNLAGGHYLRLGMGLQLTIATATAPDTSKALDLAITMFSGKTVEEVSDPTVREALKAQLLTQLEKAYEGEVMGLYFTDYVTQ
jgi:flagellar FliL protein